MTTNTFDIDNARDAMLGAIELLAQAADELHDKIADPQFKLLTEAARYCFAAVYSLVGLDDREVCFLIDQCRRHADKPPLFHDIEELAA
jgi:hypothetical protein